VALLAALAAGRAAADWLAPDASLREAQMTLRYAIRDTVGHGGDPALLDSLAIALLRVGRVADARKLFERVIADKPGDPASSAGLGKLALWADRNAGAESLLVVAGDVEQARADLYAARLRLGKWTDAAAMSEDLQDEAGSRCSSTWPTTRRWR
jgi:Flp pilus assembly protein TadD